MIAIVDYGVGNLFSLSSSLKKIGAKSIITSDPEKIRSAEKIILPGVGAFRDARKKLSESGLDRVVIECAKGGKPLLGICLGMQLLFEKSYEYGEYEGLSLLRGKVIPIKNVINKPLKIPHIGWNALNFSAQSPLFKYIKDGDFVYFVHSYCVSDCKSSLLATTEYGAPITAAVAFENIYGCQFHPEKSADVGLGILKGFVDL